MYYLFIILVLFERLQMRDELRDLTSLCRRISEYASKMPSVHSHYARNGRFWSSNGILTPRVSSPLFFLSLFLYLTSSLSLFPSLFDFTMRYGYENLNEGFQHGALQGFAALFAGWNSAKHFSSLRGKSERRKGVRVVRGVREGE